MLIEIRCDYDFKSKDVLMQMLDNIRFIHSKKLKQIWLRHSSNNNWHVRFILWLPDEFKNVDVFILTLGLRLGFGDDYGRCLHDTFRKPLGLSTDKLFDRKGKLKDGIILAKSCQEWRCIYEYKDNNRKTEKSREASKEKTKKN